MRNGLQFDDTDWRGTDGDRRGIVMVEYDDNLLFYDEVVGQAIDWPDHGSPPVFQRARELFQKGQPLVGAMPTEVRPDIELFVRGGAAILDAIEAINYNVWQERPVLTKWAKVGLVGRTLLDRVRRAAW